MDVFYVELLFSYHWLHTLFGIPKLFNLQQNNLFVGNTGYALCMGRLGTRNRRHRTKHAI